MKRFAANYIHLYSYGFLKQYYLEISEPEGLMKLLPLQEEIEKVSWLPGIISLIPATNNNDVLEAAIDPASYRINTLLVEVPAAFLKIYLPKWKIMHLNPFDFNCMLPTGKTVCNTLI